MREINILSVSQLNFYIKSIVDEDKNLNSVFLSGEISNLTDHYGSGHIYLSLKDEKSVIKGIVFSSFAKRLKFRPKNGMKVIVRGRVSIYEASGAYQIYIEDMQPEGLGALNLAFEQLKEKLAGEGLFDESRKKPLPKYPQKVGVITSKTGAVFFDIKNVLERRYPLAEIVFYPVAVQGVGASLQIINAINLFNELSAADVLIVGRGGGSAEDLWEFNDEALVRVVSNSKIPVISAVGHETDFTICDFASDRRAPTPSAAAEMAVPDKSELFSDLEYTMNYMHSLVTTRINTKKEKLGILSASKNLKTPSLMVDERKISLDVLSGNLKMSFLGTLSQHSNKFASLSGKLDVLSPLKILDSGYSLVTSEGGRVVKSTHRLKKGANLNIRVKDGIIGCVVDKIKKEKI